MPHSYLYTDECKRNIEREVPNLTNNLKVRADAPALAMVQSMNNTYFVYANKGRAKRL